VFDHIQAEFNTQSDDKKVSIADLIVLGGCAAIERAAKVLVICDSAFKAGRADASQEQTDAESFDVLEPKQTVFVII
jgi:catalase-peroxidase